MNTNKRATERAIKVMLVDDHPIMRWAVSRLIEQEDDMEVCWEASSVTEAMGLLAHANPTVIVTDISMEGRSGIDLIKDAGKLRPNTPTLVLSVHNDVMYAERAMKAGAKGYITKKDKPESIVSAVRQVAAGGVYVCEGVTAKLIGAMWSRQGEGVPTDRSQVATLSDRELEVLELIGKGLGTSRVGDMLNISVNTVETHRARIKDKLQLVDAGELTKFAVQWVTRQV